jgi:glutaredoxin
MREQKSCCGDNKSSQKKAVLYRMVTDKHICPYGIKSKDLLGREGYEVEDHHLTTRDETDAFKKKHDVETTPQTFIDGKRIGGYDDLQSFFGKAHEKGGTTYAPVIAIFATTFLMALVSHFAGFTMMPSLIGNIIGLFVAYSMCILAVQKLRDLDAFSMQFITYDILAMRWVRYSYIYPYAEAFAGIGMLAGATLAPITAPVALVIGTIGAVSVIKAVYIDKRELKCACVGGDSNVPLGAISLTENVMMVGMAIWILI